MEPPASRTRQMLRRALRGPLRPGTFDEARVVVQLPAVRRLADRFPLGGRVLDAGSGRSGLYDALLLGSPGVTRIDHVDLDPPRRPPHDARQHHHQASLTDLPFEDAQFDSALCLEVLEHIEDDRAAALELGRVLRPGGVLIASTPTPPAPEDPAHVREGYRVDDLRRLLGEAGLDVVAHEFCMHLALRGLVRAVRLQGRLVFGDAGRAYLPGGLSRAVGQLDARRPLGKPWDVVVAAVRR